MIYRPSALNRLAVCPLSGALPQVDSVSEPSERGRAIHAFLADYLVSGDAAYQRADPKYRGIIDLIDVEHLPVRPGCVLTEEPIRWTGDDGEIITEGTPDVLALTDEAIVILDHKTGWTRQLPAREHKQLLAYAVAGARRHGRRSAIIGIIQIADDGGVWSDIDELDCFDLDAAAVELRETIAKARAATPDTKPVTGEHCRYCPAFSSCPAQKRVVGLVMAEAADLVLNEETVAAVYERAKAAATVADRVLDACKAFSRSRPFVLSNGKTFGAIERHTRKIDPDAAIPVLRSLYGDEFADGLVEREQRLPQTAIEERLKAIAPPRGFSRMTRETMRALEEAGAVRVMAHTELRAFDKKEEIDNG